MKLIQSRDNPFYKQLRRLAESARERRKRGQTLLDGLHLVQSWEARFGTVDTLIVAETTPPGGEIGNYIAGRQCVVLGDALMRELGIVDTPSGLLALVDVPTPKLAVDPQKNAILLDGVQDPGNLGSLLRTAAAAGIAQALLAPECAAAWSPRALRAGQGAHFLIDIHEGQDLAAFMASYRGTTAVTALSGAVSLYEAKWQEPVAWIFGSEGQGVSQPLLDLATLRVRIPMPGAVESLNVGAAAAVCLFEMVRRR